MKNEITKLQRENMLKDEKLQNANQLAKERLQNSDDRIASLEKEIISSR